MKILFITLSNIGDVILTLPVLSALRDTFPGAKIDIVVGPRPKDIFAKVPGINGIFVYDKHACLKEKIDFIKRLRAEKYELAVDMRGSLIPVLINAKRRTRLFSINRARHKKLAHLSKLKELGIGHRERQNIYIDNEDREKISKLLEARGVKKHDVVIGVSPSCRSLLKQWHAEGFIEVIKGLLSQGDSKIVLIGDAAQKNISKKITDAITSKNLIDLTGETDLNQLFALIERMQVLLTCDSASLHIACDLGVRVVAIFGPTDPEEYGPTGKNDIVIRKNLKCIPCRKPRCKFNHECMKELKPEQVLAALAGSKLVEAKPRPAIKRILIIRTDRIGDVVLSTPTITAARKAFPNAYIAVMVSPQTREIVNGNPSLNEVIAYDKKGVFQTLCFAKYLKNKKFDLALILHSTNRVNLISFLAGIPKRVGYARGKMDFLLTDRLPYKKRLGEKHEAEYSLDVLRSIGVDARISQLVMPVRKENEENIDGLLKESGLGQGERIIVLHPGASCISKMWPQENFARVADILVEKFDARILLVSAPEHVRIGEGVRGLMKNRPVFLCGETSLGDLAALFKRTNLFISNDSGPVHIACAIGVPVISIFGRKDIGLSPERWGPLGNRSVALHKDVGCIQCLAHNCNKGFLCLKSVTVEEVIEKAGRLL